AAPNTHNVLFISVSFSRNGRILLPFGGDALEGCVIRACASLSYDGAGPRRNTRIHTIRRPSCLAFRQLGTKMSTVCPLTAAPVPSRVYTPAYGELSIRMREPSGRTAGSAAATRLSVGASEAVRPA